MANPEMVVTIVADPAGLDKGLDEAAKRSKEAGKDIQKGLTVESFKGWAETAGKVGGVVSGTLSKALSAKTFGIGEVTGQIAQGLSLIPGPVSAVASSIFGVMGGAFTALAAPVEKFNEGVSGALRGVIDGSRTAGQALSAMRVDTLTERFGTLGERATAMATSINPFGDRATPAEIRALLQSGGAAAVRVERRQRQVLTDLLALPEVREFSAEIGTERARQAFVGARMEAGVGAEAGRAQVGVLRGGGTAAEAAAAAQRETMIGRLATQLQGLGLSQEDAWRIARERLRGFAQDLEGAQRRARDQAEAAEIF